MTTQKPSFCHVLLALAVLLWTAALSYGQVQPSGIMYGRGGSPAMSTTTTPTQSPMVYHGGPVLSNSNHVCFLVGQPG